MSGNRGNLINDNETGILLPSIDDDENMAQAYEAAGYS